MAKKTKPRFSVGTRVYHKTSKKWGTVALVFESDYGDGRFYEWRYYVDHSGHRTSVPERFLTTSKRVAVEHTTND